MPGTTRRRTLRHAAVMLAVAAVPLGGLATANAAPSHPAAAPAPAVIDATVPVDREVRGPRAPTARGDLDQLAAAASAGTSYYPRPPQRVLDTRRAIGAPTAKIPAGGSVVLHVATPLGLAPGAIDAVALNVTSTNGSAQSYISVCPASVAAATCRLSSNINTYPGVNIPNLVVSKVDGLGRVRVYNNAGSTDVVADVQGYFDDSVTSGTAVGNTYQPFQFRAFDTRLDLPAPIGPGESLVVDFFDPDPDFPEDTITSVLLNLTSTAATTTSYISACPAASAEADPASCIRTSVINSYKGRTIPNLVIVPLDDQGQALFYNDEGSVHLVGDLQGIFYDDQLGAQYFPVDPSRVLDTRNGRGGVPVGKVGPRGSLRFVPDGTKVPATADAVMLNVTATGSTAPSAYVSVCPGYLVPDECRQSSNLNVTPDRTVANVAASEMDWFEPGIRGVENEVLLYNNAGSTHLLADVQGYFTFPVL